MIGIVVFTGRGRVDPGHRRRSTDRRRPETRVHVRTGGGDCDDGRPDHGGAVVGGDPAIGTSRPRHSVCLPRHVKPRSSNTPHSHASSRNSTRALEMAATEEMVYRSTREGTDSRARSADATPNCCSPIRLTHISSGRSRSASRAVAWRLRTTARDSPRTNPGVRLRRAPRRLPAPRGSAWWRMRAAVCVPLSVGGRQALRRAPRGRDAAGGNPFVPDEGQSAGVDRNIGPAPGSACCVSCRRRPFKQPPIR